MARSNTSTVPRQFYWLILIQLQFLLGCSGTAPWSSYETGSSSMAPALLGPSWQATCDHCQETLLVAADTYNPNLPTRCKSCGGWCTVAETIRPGQQVVIRHLTDTRQLKRFDLIAIAATDSSALPLVKRIWGLPGEQVEIRQGEMWIDGILLQKSLPEFQMLGVPVANFPQDRTSHWTVLTQAGTVALENLSSNSGSGLPQIQPLWELQWHYRLPARVHPQHTPVAEWLEPSRLMDSYHENQGVRRQLNIVEDYCVSLQLDCPLCGEMIIKCVHSGHIYTFTICGRDGSSTGPLGLTAVSSIKIAFCDGRTHVVTDTANAVYDMASRKNVERGGLAQALTEDTEPSQALITVFATENFEVRELTITRDLYLIVPMPWAEKQTSEPAEDGYFVLGDNLPVSIDSRGGLGRIGPQRILGVVERKP